MLHKIITDVIDTLLGSLGRASRLDLDCRHNLAGWPVGQSRELPRGSHVSRAN